VISRQRWMFVVALLAAAEVWAMETAETPVAAPLPSPLTLEFALAIAEQGHPSLHAAAAGVALAAADQAAAAAQNAPRLDLTTRLWAIDPSPLAYDQDSNDSSVRLRLSKRLYDFGHSERALAATTGEQRGREWQLMDARRRHRIEVMARYFDVLTADLAAARDNEAMAVAFVTLDKLQDRHELGQVNDVELAAQQHLYQEARRRRLAGEQQQRIQRARLANLLNRPGELSAVLQTPALPDLERPRGDLDQLTRQALATSPTLLALRERVGAAEQRMAAARSRHGPVLLGEVMATDYQRENSS
jgi:outer membrane protein TolC